jgi:hypothetical protein
VQVLSRPLFCVVIIPIFQFINVFFHLLGYESQVEKALCAIKSRFPDSLYQDVNNGDGIVEPAEVPLSVQLSQVGFDKCLEVL